MRDQSFLAKLDNMKDYKVLTVADLVTILAGMPPMMEVYGEWWDDENNLNIAFINGVGIQDGHLLFEIGEHPRTQSVQPDSEDYKRHAAQHMTRESEKATRMPEVVE